MVRKSVEQELSISLNTERIKYILPSGESGISSSDEKIVVLVVDDAPDIRRILDFTLKNSGFEVIEAIDGDDAFKKFSKEDIDIIVADILMSGMDGLELCRKVKGLEPLKRAYFILISVQGELDDKIAGFEAGADDYIPKPFDTKEVLARVRAGGRIIRLQKMLEQRSRHFVSLAFIDELTNLYNRRFFNETFIKECAKAARYQCPISMVLIDVDCFKSFNDRYGHSTGDVVLQTLAGILRKSVRESDVVARYGGEEFSVLLPNTPRASAVKLAEKLRKTVEKTEVCTGYGKLSVTISAGIGFFEKGIQGVDSPDALFEQADTALLRAKEAGRNRVYCQP